jgi:hypothetical protein
MTGYAVRNSTASLRADVRLLRWESVQLVCVQVLATES